eukprot:2832049-Prymnesium_polylepis.1
MHLWITQQTASAEAGDLEAAAARRAALTFARFVLGALEAEEALSGDARRRGRVVATYARLVDDNRCNGSVVAVVDVRRNGIAKSARPHTSLDSVRVGPVVAEEVPLARVLDEGAVPIGEVLSSVPRRRGLIADSESGVDEGLVDDDTSERLVVGFPGAIWPERTAHGEVLRLLIAHHVGMKLCNVVARVLRLLCAAARAENNAARVEIANNARVADIGRRNEARAKLLVEHQRAKRVLPRPDRCSAPNDRHVVAANGDVP